MILGKSLIKKYGIMIDLTNNFLAFWSSFYTHIRATSVIIQILFKLFTKIATIKIENLSFFKS